MTRAAKGTFAGILHQLPAMASARTPTILLWSATSPYVLRRHWL